MDKLLIVIVVIFLVDLVSFSFDTWNFIRDVSNKITVNKKVRVIVILEEKCPLCNAMLIPWVSAFKIKLALFKRNLALLSPGDIQVSLIYFRMKTAPN